MTPKRKSARTTIRRAVATDVRPAAPSSLNSRAYPTARELLAQSDAWRSWLDDALRGLLRPAALAGAVGLAAAGVGCASSTEAGVLPEPSAMAGEQVAVGPGGEVPPCPIGAVDQRTGRALPPKPPDQQNNLVPAVPIPEIAMPGGMPPVMVHPDPPDVAGDSA